MSWNIQSWVEIQFKHLFPEYLPEPPALYASKAIAGVHEPAQQNEICIGTSRRPAQYRSDCSSQHCRHLLWFPFIWLPSLSIRCGRNGTSIILLSLIFSKRDGRRPGQPHALTRRSSAPRASKSSRVPAPCAQVLHHVGFGYTDHPCSLEKERLTPPGHALALN